MFSARSLALFLVLASLCIGVAHGQLVKLNNFDRPVNNALLPSPSIKALYQDQHGFIWFGTTVGLIRLDGSTQQEYQHNPALRNTLSNSEISIAGITEHAGYLWIGTSKGLNRYDYVSDSFTRYLDGVQYASDQCGNVVSSIVAKDAETLWLATNNGLCAFNILTGESSVIQHEKGNPHSLSSNAISKIVKDKEGNLWLGTNNGLNFFNTSTAQVRRFLSKNDSLQVDDNPFLVFTLYLDGETLWIGTLQGLKTLNTRTFAIGNLLDDTLNKPFPGKIISRFLRDANDDFWIATFDEGLCKISSDRKTWQCFKHQAGDAYSLVDNRTSALMIDREQQLWVGTWGGLCKMGVNPGFETIKINYDNAYLPEPAVTAILEIDSANVLIGTADQGVYKAASLAKKSPELQQLNKLYIRSITQGEHAFWLGTSSQGIHQLDKTTFRTQKAFENARVNQWVYNILIDNKGKLWVTSASTGLSRFETETSSISKQFLASRHPDSLSSNHPWPIIQGSDGTIWIGTINGGLNRLDPKNNTFQRYQSDLTDSNSISHNDVIHISEDSEGYIWLATQLGVNRFNPKTTKFKAYTEANGLADNQVFCVLNDAQERVWIATRQGLSVFDKQSETFTNFYAENGLPKTQFFPDACHIGPSGRFYFGTESGLLTFRPETIKVDETTPPPIAITGFELNREKQALTSPLELDYNQNTLTFYVAALSFVNATKNEIYYRLLGSSNTAWIALQSRDIRFEDLNPGHYILEISATNSFGHKSNSTLRQAFSIAPPYWRTWWFRMLAILSLLLLGYIGYGIRVQYLLGLAQKTYESELKIERLRNDIAADFHDGLGGDLGSLGIDMDLLANQPDIPVSIKEHLKGFTQKLKRISALRREMSWIMDANYDSFKHLIDRIPQIAFDIVPRGKLHLDLPQDAPEIQLPMYARRHLLFFMKEAMHNAVKHAQASTIVVKITQEHDAHSFCISDDGIGFDPERVERGRGLENMEHRANALNGKLAILKQDPTGTIIKLTVYMEDFSHDEG